MPVWSADNNTCPLQVCCEIFLLNRFSQSDATGVQTLSQANFGAGTGRIWLTNVACTGSERVLMNCTADSSGTNSCTHAQDVGVRCQTGIIMLEFIRQ